MFALGNNPVVGLATRKWMAALSSDGLALDQVSRNLMAIVMDKCRETSPCGTVFDLARSLGATPERALLAASVSELFYAVCSFTDDLQDGDADDYLDGIPFAIRLNLQAHLNCLVAVRARDLAIQMENGNGLDLVVDIYRNGAQMLNGQAKEIMRDPWDIGVYEEVARRIAGDQFGAQLGLAAYAARVDIGPWVRLGRAYGALLQLVVDRETGDERLFVLDQKEIARLQRKLVAELKEASIPVREAANKITGALLQRCSNSS